MLNPDLTVIYYTNHKEIPKLEEKSQQHILNTIGDTPLISVSHKPIDFGQNICVGDVGSSSHNIFRQMQVGATAATTKFVCPTEADLFHPTEYFEFVPPRDDTFYTCLPFWVLVADEKVFVRKSQGSEAFIVCGRQILIDRIDVILANRGVWNTDESRHPPLLNSQVRREFITFPNPAMTFKTNRATHRKFPHDRHSRTQEFPGWGTADEVLKRFTG